MKTHRQKRVKQIGSEIMAAVREMRACEKKRKSPGYRNTSYFTGTCICVSPRCRVTYRHEIRLRVT